ncbi:MAG: thioesterase family protein [Acidimicrobiales bacterium]
MTHEAVPSSFFVTDGDAYVGTILSRGPWDDGSAHGGPVAALIGREVEQFDPDPDLATVRYTIELLRPVPLGVPLRLDTAMLRPGKRVRLVGVSVFAGDTEVARAVALRVKRVPDDAPRSRPDEGIAFRTPDECGAAPLLIEGRVGIMNGLDVRSASGSAIATGPATYWFKVERPLVDDEPITPLTRLLIPADFGNGVASATSFDTHVFINPELTVHVFRMPDGDWVANDARTWMEPGGTAVAEGTLTDRDGPIGRAMQSLFIDSR